VIARNDALPMHGSSTMLLTVLHCETWQYMAVQLCCSHKHPVPGPKLAITCSFWQCLAPVSPTKTEERTPTIDHLPAEPGGL
jgi:hypothetical protein